MFFSVRTVIRLDFRRSHVFGQRPSPGEERGLLSRTAAGDRDYTLMCSIMPSIPDMSVGSEMKRSVSVSSLTYEGNLETE